jgi:hypothetical protein
MLVAQLTISQDIFDFSRIPRIIASAADVCKSPIDWMFAYLGFCGPLLFRDKRLASNSLAAIVRGLGLTGTRKFFLAALEYMVLQLRQGMPRETTEHVRELVKEAVECSKERSMFLADLRGISVIQTFFEFEDDNNGKTFIFKKQRREKPDALTSSETELQKLVNILKRQS